MDEQVARIMRDGKPLPNATKIATAHGHVFWCYRTGPLRYERICPELNAMLDQPGRHTAFYNGTVSGVRVAKGPRGFTTRKAALAAIEAEAIKQGIMRADGTLVQEVVS